MPLLSPHRGLSFALGLLAGLLALTSPLVAQTDQSLHIGVLAPLSGPFERLGEQVRRGVELAVARDANDEPITVIYIDDQCDEDQGRDGANQLVGAQVDFVVGGVCWRPAVAAQAVLEAQNIPFIASGVRYPGFTDDAGGETLRLNGRDDLQANRLVDAIVTGELDGLAGASVVQRPLVLLYTEGTYGRPLAESVRDGLADLGVVLALYEAFDAETGLDRAAVRAEAEAPGLVIVLAGQADTALMITALRERLADIPVLAGDSALTAEFPLLAGSAGQDVVFTRPTAWRTLMEDATLLQLEEGADPMFGLVLPSFAATQVGLDQAMGEEQPFDTVLGALRFDTNGDVALPSFQLWQWRDGTVWPLGQGVDEPS